MMSVIIGTSFGFAALVFFTVAGIMANKNNRR